MRMLETARAYAAAGLSVLPIRADGSKAPPKGWSWKPYQERIATPDELRSMFSNGCGIGIIGGRVSGNLEILDFETGAPFDDWLSIIESADAPLAGALVIIETPSGGRHVPIRCGEGIENNQKLAMSEDNKVLIETRGEGGYVVTVGSPGACHKTGRTYALLQGDLIPGAGEHTIPTITAAQRALLLDAARSFNEAGRKKHHESASAGSRPGDDYNRRASWDEVLGPHGWTRAGMCREETLWRRPGKNDGLSATSNYKASDLLYVFSTNAHPLDADTSYSKFAAYALLNQGGDYAAAARELARQGYGEPKSAPKMHTEPGDYDEQKRFPLTDAGNAEFIAARNADRWRFDHVRRRNLLYEGHRWRQDDTGQVVLLAKEAARARYLEAARIEEPKERAKAASWAIQSESRARIESALALARAEAPIADSGQDWDNRPMLLAAANGVIDLETGKLRDGKPEDRLILHTPVSYDPAAQCPRFERFMAEILVDAELIDFLLRVIGYSLTGLTIEQVLLILYGTGANGKSVLLAVLRALLGEYAYNMPFSTVELHNRSAIPNDVAALADKRLVTAAETNDGSRLNEARIKALTGCDPITARFLHSEFFTFRPVAKFWLSVNHKPRVADDSFGFWRRVRLIPFTQQFRENADPDLERKLMDELPGVLAYAVRGCLEWQRRGLKAPPSVMEATEEYRRDSDPLSQFIDERCLVGEGYSATAKELYAAYKSWAESSGFRDKEILSVTAFGRRMGDGFVGGKTKEGKFYAGVRLI